MAKEFNYKVIKELGNLSEDKFIKYPIKVKIISWNGNEPKIDIRKWSEDDEVMGKGISIDFDEAIKLYNILEEALEQFEEYIDSNG